MQFINDDMDELFRRAAKSYPLDTNSADWSQVAAALQEQDPKTAQPQRSGRTRFLWLLLLVPFVFVCNNYVGRNDATEKAALRPTAPKSIHTQTKKPGSPNTVTGPDVESNIKDEVNNHPLERITASGKLNTASDLPTALSTRRPGLQKEQEFLISNDWITRSGEDELHSEKDHRQRLIANGIGYRNDIFTFDGMDLPQLPLLSADGRTAARKTKKQKGFYVGLTGGLEATSVKFQKVENTGFDYGVMLGYQFHKKWSIETGLFSGNKFYYSEGQHYNTSKLYLPPNSKVLELSGNCRMMEIPLNLRYTIASTDRHSWFATAGGASYIMKDEYYDYLYYYGNSGTTAVHSKKYNNSSTNIFAAMHVSGGYTHRLGKFADLRLEPYVKIPLTGMGSGKLPLLGTGIHVGLTKKLYN